MQLFLHFRSRKFVSSTPVSLPIRWTALFIVFMTSLLSSNLFAVDQDIKATEGWIRETPPTAKNAAAFITLHNLSNTIKTLVDVQCQTTVAARCEIHEHVLNDGRMRMQKVKSIEIPAVSAVNFSPGGYHIMLINIATPLIAGSTIELIFKFADQSAYRVQLPVKAISQE